MRAATDFMHSLHSVGFIETVPARTSNQAMAKKRKKTLSVEECVGKITAIFSPYFPRNFPEGKFIALQAELGAVLGEILRERGRLP